MSRPMDTCYMLATYLPTWWERVCGPPVSLPRRPSSSILPLPRQASQGLAAVPDLLIGCLWGSPVCNQSLCSLALRWADPYNLSTAHFLHPFVQLHFG